MMTRKQYLKKHETATDLTQLHRKYYSQFVTSGIQAMILRFVSLHEIRESTDPHFNDIAISRWDLMHAHIPADVRETLKKAGDFYSLVSSTCICKEAARQLKEIPID